MWGKNGYNSPDLTSTLSHINPVHILSPYFLVIHFNIIFPPTPRPSTRSHLSGIPTDIPPPCLVSPMHAAYSAPLSPITFKILKSSPVQFCQLHITSSFTLRNFLHTTSLENIHKLCCFSNATDQGAHNRHNYTFRILVDCRNERKFTFTYKRWRPLFCNTIHSAHYISHVHRPNYN